ncbi:uncharacterized protein TRIVIDRAFT_195705 [Trichoderma virens Gv29-8]|uniref:Uncharacterized protein n=1 Tax=Hypocrea virens (strain Gv29-8 / FGSC 10586) TaxID=413071 RepID=G9NA72_HYPVG|nr:uncharacterized protein TRIVIDRAFT_195705 [Trichoderma virens Gv29-8]EHK16838.1 hypothetical protein TRIVIDRAFT_195705 [Trichoderma virens Gv29-8]
MFAWRPTNACLVPRFTQILRRYYDCKVPVPQSLFLPNHDLAMHSVMIPFQILN